MSEPVLLEQREDRVICVTMNRPRVMNALNAELRSALTEFWKRFRDDPTLAVAIITGAGGRAFSTGRDLKETATLNAKGSRPEYEISGAWGYPDNLKIGKPVIAAIDGYCMAAGLKIAIGCDIRICTESSAFGNPQVKVGRGTEMPLRLVKAGIPRAVVMDMVMSGEPLPAEQALRWGLVSRVVSKDALMPEAWKIAKQISQNSSLVVTGIKNAAEAGVLDLPINEALQLWKHVIDMSSNADAVEGARAFSDKRAAQFS